MAWICSPCFATTTRELVTCLYGKVGIRNPAAPESRYAEIERAVAGKLGEDVKVRLDSDKGRVEVDVAKTPLAGVMNYRISADGTALKTEYIDVLPEFWRNGVSELMVARVLEATPSIRTVEAGLTNLNLEIANGKFQELTRGKRGKNTASQCAQAMLETPQAKMAIRLGFARVVEARCGLTFHLVMGR